MAAQAGHFFILLVFVSVVLAGAGFFLYARNQELRWWRYGCWMYAIHGMALCAAAVILVVLLLSDRFDYHYVWAHSMLALPTAYKVAAFWEGQEGSFMLWMLGHLVLGGVVLGASSARARAPMLGFLCLTQCVLASMLLGVVVGEAKWGSSPFMLLRDVLDAPIYLKQPDFVPEDGTGLSPLLQNYWMVIHPPVLFMGFALVQLPYASLCGALFSNKSMQDAMRVARRWTLVAVLVLGTGILLGAIWAYETLNFGGYWNWDPVENAVYVPWLVLIAALHLQGLYLRKGVVLRSAVGLTLLAFWLVLYATFLIRSGVLGDSSVHAFTDAGLSLQLLLAMAFMIILPLGLLYVRRKMFYRLPAIRYQAFHTETYLVGGVAVLLLMALQVLLPTSLPVWNALAAQLGFESNLAPPPDPIAFYASWQLYFVLLLLLLSGFGQLLFWRYHPTKKELYRRLSVPLVPSILLATGGVLLFGMQRLDWIFMLTAGCYAVGANGQVFLFLVRRQPRSAAGALAHIGVALMALGVLFSSSYAKTISANHTGLIWHKDFPDEVNEESMLLFLDQTRQMNGFSLTFLGERSRLEGVSDYVPNAHLVPLFGTEFTVLAKQDLGLKRHNGTPIHKGDTLVLQKPVRNYFEILYQEENSEQAQSIFPSAQAIPADQSMLYAPYILRTLFKDIYAHVRTFSDPEQATWSAPDTLHVTPKQHFYANDYTGQVLSLTQVDTLEGIDLGPKDIVVVAEVALQGSRATYHLSPALIIREDSYGLVADKVPELGVQLMLTHIDPKKDQIELVLRTTQLPWVILEVIDKPLINLLWVGGGVLGLGLLLAIFAAPGYFNTNSKNA